MIYTKHYTTENPNLIFCLVTIFLGGKLVYVSENVAQHLFYNQVKTRMAFTTWYGLFVTIFWNLKPQLSF